MSGTLPPVGRAGLAPRLLLLRHGETVWNREGRYNSHTDLPIDTATAERLSRTGAALRGAPVERILTSPLLRARQSAELVLAAGRFEDARMELRAELVEMDFGDFEGKTPAEILGSDMAALYRSWLEPGAQAADTPGGETWASAAARGRMILDEILEDGRTTLVIGHGYMLRLMIVTALGGMPPQAMRRFPLDNGAFSTLEHGEGYWRLLRHNHTSL